VFRARIIIFLLTAVAFVGTASAQSAKIVKVLPHFVDAKGRHSLAPSLYERDAYQDELRKNPEKRASIRYDVQWKASRITRPVVMRVELRGSDKSKRPKAFQTEREVTPKRFGSTWTAVGLQSTEFAQFQEILAWRITVWDGDKMLAEQKSFLW
jgi:hypothetical protein